jgi:hypothetical protein
MPQQFNRRFGYGDLSRAGRTRIAKSVFDVSSRQRPMMSWPSVNDGRTTPREWSQSLQRQ